MTPPAPALTLDNVTFTYDPAGPFILDGVNLAVPEGSLFGIVGPNGAGKSTLLGVMTGRLRPTSGGVRLREEPLASLSRRDIARRVAVVPQSEDSAFAFTVLEIVMMGRAPHRTGWMGGESATDRDMALAALEEADVAHLADRPVSRLSGGERQLVLIARALAQATPVLLLDEPTASLDLAHIQRIARIVGRRSQHCGQTCVLVSHDLNLVASLCGEMAVLSRGRVAAQGRPDELLTEELLSEVYGAETWLGRSPAGHVTVGLAE
ncbi:MAG: ABC transporter ATP-binding protein [Sumerlaeia bacterium]